MKKLLAGVYLLGIALPEGCAAQSGSGSLAWAPSKPDSAPVLDYVRRVLTCDSQACKLRIVHSQQELMEAMEFTATPTMQVIPMRHSADGGRTWTATDVTVPVYLQPSRLILGSCFGA